MELLIGAVAITSVLSAVFAVEDWVNWENSYKELGEDCRQKCVSYSKHEINQHE